LSDDGLDTAVGGDGEDWLLSARGCWQRSQHGRSSTATGTLFAYQKVS